MGLEIFSGPSLEELLLNNWEYSIIFLVKLVVLTFAGPRYTNELKAGKTSLVAILDYPDQCQVNLTFLKPWNPSNLLPMTWLTKLSHFLGW